MKFIVEPSQNNIRIDTVLNQVLPNLSRNQIQNLIKTQQILVNKNPIKKNFILSTDDLIEVKKAKKTVTYKPSKKLSNLPLEILYEDDDCLVINKEAGITVHQDSKKRQKITLVEILRNKNIPLAKVGEEERHGIVHRLDKNTSGLMLIAKTEIGYHHLRAQFEKRKIKKIYIALIHGIIEAKQGEIQSPIARDSVNRTKMTISGTKKAKHAVSKFKLIKQFKDKCLMKIDLITGRTHQIRVHFKAINHPLIGDEVYGKKDPNLSRQFLHAHELHFTNTLNKKIKIKKDLSDDLKQYLDSL